MAIVSTDDEARNLKYTYLGPVNFRLPTATIPEWMVFLTAAGPLTVLTCVMSYRVFAALGPIVLIAGVGFCVGVVVFLCERATRVLFKAVDHDRTVRYYLRLIQKELTAPRPELDSDERTISLTIPARVFRKDPS